MAKTEDDYFIDGMLDALRNHMDPSRPTTTELGTGESIWCLTTPAMYLHINQSAHKEHAEAVIRREVTKAMEAGEIDRVLFLIVVLARQSKYQLDGPARMP